MPNESVKCPNCGSGDVQQVTTESYACQQCHTNFHWVNPTKATVASNQKVCTCGKFATGVCYNCGAGVCEEHIRSANVFFNARRNLRKSIRKYASQQMLSYISLDPTPILCKKCATKYNNLADAVIHRVFQMAEQGKACKGPYGSSGGYCLSEHVEGHCAICGAGFCSEHKSVCTRCGKLVCFNHITYRDNGSRLCTTCDAVPIPLLDKLWKWLGLKK